MARLRRHVRHVRRRGLAAVAESRIRPVLAADERAARDDRIVLPGSGGRGVPRGEPARGYGGARAHGRTWLSPDRADERDAHAPNAWAWRGGAPAGARARGAPRRGWW